MTAGGEGAEARHKEGKVPETRHAASRSANSKHSGIRLSNAVFDSEPVHDRQTKTATMSHHPGAVVIVAKPACVHIHPRSKATWPMLRKDLSFHAIQSSLSEGRSHTWHCPCVTSGAPGTNDWQWSAN